MSIRIDSQNFQAQIIRLYEDWNDNPERWGNANMLCFCLGKITDESPEQSLSTVVFTWLIGYQFTETLIFIQKNPKIVRFLTAGGKKIKILKSIQLRGKRFELKIVEKTGSKFTSWFNMMKKAGCVGTITEDERYMFGPYIKAYLNKFHELVHGREFTHTDVSLALRRLHAVKAAYEINLMKKSAKFTTIVLTKYLRKEIERIIDSEQSLNHLTIAENTEKMIDDPSRMGLNKLSPSDVSVFEPILISSGENVDLAAKETDTQNISFSTINVYLGTNYKAYGSVVGRTYMIDPSKSQETDYNFLYELYKKAASECVPGTTMQKLYQSLITEIRGKRPEMERYFMPDIGFSCGIENNPEKTFLINSRNREVLSENMTIVLRLAFQNVPEKDPKYTSSSDRKKYTLVIANTLLLQPQTPKYLTGGDVIFKNVAYSFDDEEEGVDDEKNDGLDLSNIISDESGGRGYRTRGKKESSKKIALEQARASLQDAIFEKKQKKGKRFNVPDPSEEKKVDYSFEREISRGRLVSYKSNLNYPAVRRNKIQVDEKKNSLLLPINGIYTPFHISTIRNVSKSKESEGVYIRFNFKNPKSSRSKLYHPAVDHPSKMFVKEMAFRTRDGRNAESTLKKIKDLRKKVQDREKDINNKKQTEKQEKLILTRGQCPKLKEIHMRPSQRGKKTVGRLEAHENGFRFISTNQRSIQPVRIIYKNIKHAFYQPAKNESHVIIHFHLKSPIILGKKLVRDIQFLTEVMEEFEQLTGRFRRGLSDREAIREERREKELRARLNQEFYRFCKQVQEKVSLKFDIPFRELEFDGTPFKQQSRLVPTTDCLVNLTDYPFFVLPLDDIEIAVFERISFGLRSFDLVFVKEDYSEVITVTTIPKKKLDMVRDWLTKVEIKYFECKMNLVWPAILKQIVGYGEKWDPWNREEGWKSFLTEENEDINDPGKNEGEGTKADMYVPPDEDDEDSEEYDEDAHVVDEEEEDSEEEEEEVFEEAPSWRELHKQAFKADKKRKRWEQGDVGPARKKRKF